MEGGGQRSQVYADYYTVIPTINSYYYTMIDYYRIYLEGRMNGKDDKRIITRIQGHMCVLYNLLKHYKAIKENKKERIVFGIQKIEIGEVFTKFEIMVDSSQRMNFKGITQMKDALILAYHLLGLSDIEKAKQSFMAESQQWSPNG